MDTVGRPDDISTHTVSGQSWPSLPPAVSTLPHLSLVATAATSPACVALLGLVAQRVQLFNTKRRSSLDKWGRFREVRTFCLVLTTSEVCLRAQIRIRSSGHWV